MTKRILPDLAAQQRIAELEAQVATLNKLQNAALKLKVSTKGAISVYGLGRFPVTLYSSQMTKFLDNADAIRAFLSVFHP